MFVAYFGNDIFLNCFRHLVDSDRFKVLRLFSADYGGQGYDFAQSARRIARESGIPVQTTPVLARDLRALERQGCEAIISAGYSHKIPNCSGGPIRYAFNIHPSLLPQGAGPMPLPWAILKGLDRTGVTLHKLSDVWDGGDLLLQESFALRGSENLEELLASSQALALKLLDRFMDAPDIYWRRAVPQSPVGREYWPKIPLKDYIVDWTWELEKIGRFLRTYRYAFPDGSIEFIADVNVSSRPHPHAPGTLLSEDGEWRTVAVKEGIVSYRVCRKLAVFRH